MEGAVPGIRNRRLGTGESPVTSTATSPKMPSDWVADSGRMCNGCSQIRLRAGERRATAAVRRERWPMVSSAAPHTRPRTVTRPGKRVGRFLTEKGNADQADRSRSKRIRGSGLRQSATIRRIRLIRVSLSPLRQATPIQQADVSPLLMGGRHCPVPSGHQRTTDRPTASPQTQQSAAAARVP